MIAIRFHRGIELPDHGLWLDPWDEKPFAFVSHAHSDHIGNHREIILSKATSLLMRERLPGQRAEHALDFGRTTHLHGFAVTLLPAGHIFGSAQCFLQDAAGRSLLYTGDFKLRASLSAEPTEWRQADTLIMETTFGLPKYRFPPSDEIIGRMTAFCAEALEENAVPVLLGYSLGKSQEILCALVRAGMKPMLHGSVFRMTEIYRKLRAGFPCEYERYDAAAVAGRVLICPPSVARSAMLAKIPNRRVAVLTGWAVDPNARFRYGCDAAFPLSDHADYDDLLRYVELVKPARVLTLHGFASQFARDLRGRGVEAWALSEENQLELSLTASGKPPGRQSARRDEAARNEETAVVQENSSPSFSSPGGGGSVSASASPRSGALAVPPDNAHFAAFAAVCEEISATTRKLRKIELLRDYFRSLAPEDQLPLAAVYLTGRAFAQSDPRVVQAGWAVIKRALLAVSRATEGELRDIASRHADAGRTAFDILQNRTRPEPLPLVESRRFYERLGSTRGPIAKAELLQGLLARISPVEAKYVVSILTGDLRIGLKEGLVEEAIASAFEAPLAGVKEANMLLGDIGEAARLAAQHALDRIELRLFTPIKCMLASPEPTAEAIWKRLREAHAKLAASVRSTGGDGDGNDGGGSSDSAPGAVVPSAALELSTPAPPELPASAAAAPLSAWVEDKFDGIRAQLHRNAERAEIFTRDLKRVTAQFEEIAHAARALSNDVIFDGEMVAFEQGRRLTFFDLQKRLGRKMSGDLFATGDAGGVPVRFMIFDLLWLDGRSLLKTPLRERRALLEQLALPGEPGHFERVAVSCVHSAAEIDGVFDRARTRGNEGLLVKDAASLYTPGRRGLAWLKLKKELATLDVVVVGAEYGHGKRSKVLSDYTFAVRDEKSGELLPIGKAYSGLTDAEIAQLTEHFMENTIAQHGRYRQVKPNVVLEVAFDCVQPSERHASGLALRFPRIKGIRTDKTAREIDTLDYARSLLGT